MCKRSVLLLICGVLLGGMQLYANDVILSPPINTSPSCFRYKLSIELKKLELSIDDDEQKYIRAGCRGDVEPEISFIITDVKIFTKTRGIITQTNSGNSLISTNCIGRCYESSHFTYYSDPDLNIEIPRLAAYKVNSENKNSNVSYAKFGRMAGDIPIPVINIESDNISFPPGEINKIEITFKFIEVDVYDTDKLCTFGACNGRFLKCRDCNDYNLEKKIILDYSNESPRVYRAPADPAYQYLEQCDIYDYLEKSEQVFMIDTDNNGIPLDNKYIAGAQEEYIKVYVTPRFFCYSPSMGYESSEMCSGHHNQTCTVGNGIFSVSCNNNFKINKNSGDPDIRSNDNDEAGAFYTYASGDKQKVGIYSNPEKSNYSCDVYTRINGGNWILSDNIESYDDYTYPNNITACKFSLSPVFKADNYLLNEYNDKYTKYEYAYVTNYNGCPGDEAVSYNSLNVNVYKNLNIDKVVIKQPCLSSFPNVTGSANIFLDGGRFNLNKVELIKSFYLNTQGPLQYEDAVKYADAGKQIENFFEYINANSPIFFLENEPIADGVTSLYLSNTNLSFMNGDDIDIEKKNGYFYLGNLPYGIYAIKATFNDKFMSDCDDKVYWFCVYPAINPVITISNEEIVCQPAGMFEFTANADKPVKWNWQGFTPTNPLAGLPENEQYVSESTNAIQLVSNNLNCKNVIATDVNGCVGVKQIEIPDFNPPAVTKNYQTNVLNISASRLEGTWLNDFSDMAFTSPLSYNNLLSKNEFESFQAGAYRALSTYDYLSGRVQLGEYDKSNKSNIALDGIFHNKGGHYEGGISVVGNSDIDITLFNWDNPFFENSEPNWVKNNEITKYSSVSEATESKDILGNYSAALFSYGNTLPIAVGVNARYGEIAFEGFEEYAANSIVTQLSNATCNFDIVNKIEDVSFKKYEKYAITNASGRYSIVDMPSNKYTPQEFESLTLKVQAKSIPSNIGDPIQETLTTTSGQILQNNCNNISGQNLQGNLIKFEEGVPGFNSDQIDNCNQFWTGNLYVEHSIPAYNPDPNNTYSSKIVYTDEYAHTGKISVKINAPVVLEQYSLQLKTGFSQKYVLSGWIRTSQSINMPPKIHTNYCIENNIGIYLQDNIGNNIPVENINYVGIQNSPIILPTGPIIDGWQKFNAIFYLQNASDLVNNIRIVTQNNTSFYLDDLRLSPYKGNIQTYVYDPSTLRQEAILDYNNYATIYKYDDEGKLFQIQKETAEGIKTIQIKQDYLIPNSEE